MKEQDKIAFWPSFGIKENMSHHDLNPELNFMQFLFSSCKKTASFAKFLCWMDISIRIELEHN